MKQQVRFFLLLWAAGVLTSCSMPYGPSLDSTRQAVQEQYQTVSALLTATALASSASAPAAASAPGAASAPAVAAGPKATAVYTDARQTNLPRVSPVSPTATERRTIAATVFPAAMITPSPKVKPSGAERISAPCLIAQPGHILDVSIPDNTQMMPGAFFSKTWRLVNAGSCPWTRDYAVVWFSGDDLGIVHVQHFETNVIPGQAVDVTVDMIAPQAPGTYQSNWKLRSPQGTLFGIGPTGASPFWVRVAVLEIETPTVAAPAPTATATPVVLVSGVYPVTLESALDLDTGQSITGSGEDLALRESTEGQLVLEPVNEARFVIFGSDPPDLAACLTALVIDPSLHPDEMFIGNYYCYRTSEGLPGRFLLTSMDVDNRQAALQLITWAAP